MDSVEEAVAKQVLFEFGVQIIKVKAFLQMCIVRRRYLRQKEKSTTIQKYLRGFLVYNKTKSKLRHIKNRRALHLLKVHLQQLDQTDIGQSASLIQRRLYGKIKFIN
jgi:hypothetical protein